MHAGRQVLKSVFLTCAAFAVSLALPILGQAQELSPEEAHSIARDAYIYGFPMVESYRTMYAFAIDTDGEEFKAALNSIKHETNVFTPADRGVVTPNADTPYSFLWMDLRTEPIVLGVPAIEDSRYYSIQLTDLFKYNFDYIGSRATGSKAGRYMIAGPDWQGDAPAGITKVIRCETQFATAIYRTQLRGPDDLENVKGIQKQFTVQTLSEFTGGPKPESANQVEFPAPPPETDLDFTFFSTLNFLLQFCLADASEKEQAAQMARIGVSAGASFDAQEFGPEIQEAVKKGMAEGGAAITAATGKLKAAEVIGTRDYLGEDYLIKRAVAARLGRYSNSKEEALYPLYLSDAEGKPLDASSNNYVLRLGPDELPPVNAFWSITMYDNQSKSLVDNPIDRYRLSSLMTPTFIRDKDGGMSFYIQHQAPDEERAANWLPTPDGTFYLVMRLYRPKPEAFDGTWTPPLIWKEGSDQITGMQKPAGTESAEEVKPSVLVDEPKPELERPTVWGEPTEVKIAIYMIDVDEVNSADQSFAASVYVEARWKNPLLRHKGPGPMHRGISDVWTPRLTIIGQQMAWRSFPEAVEIQPDGTIIYRQKIWGRFSQPLQLQEFPLDQQTLSIHIVAAGLMEKHVKMVPLVKEGGRTSGIASKFSLPDFDVIDWEASAQPYFTLQGVEGIAGYEMRIQVNRQVTFYILKVIIPLSLIVIMSWLPRWIDPKESGTNIGISTTAFLTLVAYLFAITVLLPRVSYITRIDRFILLSTLMVFGGLVQTVATTAMLKNQKQRLVETIDRWSRFVYPVLLAIVIAVSFVF